MTQRAALVGHAKSAALRRTRICCEQQSHLLVRWLVGWGFYSYVYVVTPPARSCHTLTTERERARGIDRGFPPPNEMHFPPRDAADGGIAHTTACAGGFHARPTHTHNFPPIDRNRSKPEQTEARGGARRRQQGSGFIFIYHRIQNT